MYQCLHRSCACHRYFDWLQGTPQSWTQDALARVDVKLCAVRVTDNASPVRAEVRVLAPGQRCSLVRAPVAIGLQRISSTHNKDGVTAIANRVEASGCPVGNLVETAQLDNIGVGCQDVTCRVVRHLGTSFHAARKERLAMYQRQFRLPAQPNYRHANPYRHQIRRGRRPDC